MDKRLIEAAQTGKVDKMLHLLKENPLMLHTVALSSGENPLHIASIAGHLDFVKEVLRMKPEMAGELNQEGFSPLHLASANGYLEIVREILKSNKDHCRIKSRDRRTALHYAAMKGRVGVVEELLSACAETVEDITVRGETALHLAVKNHQFGTLSMLVEWLKRSNKVEFLNKKDEQGNTILHLATSTKQREVVELVLGKNDGNLISNLEVNATNKVGLTALDVLLLFPSEAGDRETEEILRQAGALKSQIERNHKIVVPEHSDLDRERTNTINLLRSQVRKLLYFQLVKGRDSESEQRNALMVIAVLIATTTHQAGLRPPGGIWTDYAYDGLNDTRPHYAGDSILGTNSPLWFGLFVFFNTTGFYMSFFMIHMLTYGFPLMKELRVCMMGLAGTYWISIYTITPTRWRPVFYVISILISLVIGIPIILRARKLRLEESKRLENTKPETC